MKTGTLEICTCPTPETSHVRPGICYACWKIIRDGAPDQAQEHVNPFENTVRLAERLFNGHATGVQHTQLDGGAG